MYFPIFPQTGESAILTAVLVGVFWMFVLMETLGWPFSGLIVPGFLAAIYIVDPVACVVTVGEAAVSAALAWLITDVASRAGVWNRFFGRDQFFLVVVISTLVRLVAEWGWLEQLAVENHGSLLGSLNGVGLVLVPLVSYTLYRAGVVRGIPQLLIPASLSWAVLSFVIMPHTNLSLSLFQLDHEDLRNQFAENPRAWILLLVGSFVGSRVKLRYGWDFGGIVVPGLLAIAWHTPIQLLGAVTEVLVLTLLMHVVTALPVLRTANLSGGRPLVLCFFIEYLLQQTLTLGLAESHPEIRISHILGIGYIMPSLLAVRCWRTGDTLRVMLPALGTSLVGAALGTMLSVAVAALNPFLPSFQPPLPLPEDPLLAMSTVPTRKDAGLHLDPFWLVEREFARQVASGDVPPSRLGLTTSRVGEGVVAYESSPFLPRGAGALYRRQSGEKLAIVVGAPVIEPLQTVAGLALQERMDAQILVMTSDRVLLPSPFEAGAASAGFLVLHVGIWKRASLLEVPRDVQNRPMVAALEEATGLTAQVGEKFALHLDADAAIRVAEASLGEDPAPWPGLLVAAEGDETVVAPPVLAQLLEPTLVDQLVLQPVIGMAGGVLTRPGSLRLAAGLASRMGLKVYRGVDPSGLPILAVGTPPNQGLPSWVVVAREGGEPRIIEVPDACTEEGMMPLGYSLWQSTHAAVYFARCGRPDEMDRIALSATSLYATVFRRALLSLPSNLATVSSLRGWMAYSAPGADIIVTRTNVASVAETVPEWLEPLLSPFRVANATVAPFTARTNQFGFRDPLNPRRKLGDSLIGRRYATVYISPAVRAWFEPTRLAMEEERRRWLAGEGR